MLEALLGWRSQSTCHVQPPREQRGMAAAASKLHDGSSEKRKTGATAETLTLSQPRGQPSTQSLRVLRPYLSLSHQG